MASKKKNRTVSEIMKHEKEDEVEKKSKEIASWIESLLGEKLPKSTLRESLLDGVVLCKIINALAPSALKRFHKKPRMLAMKIENIGFFLATCKTRMNLPPALLFQPTDIHDDSNNLNSMSKVLNVLSFLRGDGDVIEVLPDDDDEDAPEGEQEAEANPEHEPPEPEPEPEPEADVVEPEPPKPASRVVAAQVSAPAPTPTPASVSAAATSAVASVSRNHVSGADDSDAQSEIMKVITDFVNNELSVESKKKLLRLLQTQISSFEESVINASDDQLVSISKSLGIEDFSKTKGRSALVSDMLKKGRIQ